MKKVIKIVGIVFLCLFAIGILSAIFSKKDNAASVPTTSTPPGENTATTPTPVASPEDAEKQNVKEQLKAKAAQDWPNDYTTQEYWINKEMEAYEYMKSIPDDDIKRKAQQDWPIDFSTQKYWYNKQIEARDRLK